MVILDASKSALKACRSFFAGPCTNLPVASNSEPWQWQRMTLFSGSPTSHPQCVHFEENAAAIVSENLDTMMGFFYYTGSGFT
jgi:hypothetical protein